MALERRDCVRGKCLAFAALSTIFLAACTSSSDSLLQLGITPDQLAASRTGEASSASPALTTAALPDHEDAGGSDDSPLPTPRTDAAPQREEAQSASAAPPDAQTALPASETTVAAHEEAGSTTTNEEAAVQGSDPDESKRSFLSAFFSPSPPRTNAAARALAETTAAASTRKAEERKAEEPAAEPSASRKEQTGNAADEAAEVAARASTQVSLYSMDSLPGVRPGESLFEISSASSMEDIDVYENTGSYQLASAAGMAHLGANGLLKQRESVETGCFKPQLVRLLKTIEGHYNRRVVVTSGYRSPEHNRRVNGARRSLHMSCSAADIVVDGVSKWELASFVRAMPGRGGVGTYCHTNAIHVDVGPRRDWNWRCRGS